MPSKTLSAREFVEDYLQPLAAAVDAAWADLDPKPVLIPPPPPKPGSAALAVLVAALELTTLYDTDVTIDLPALPDAPAAGGEGGDAPSFPAPTIQPIDPAEALQAVAAAFNRAESVLNGANLALGSAAAEVRLTVQVGEVAAADATLTLAIGPAPQP